MFKHDSSAYTSVDVILDGKQTSVPAEINVAAALLTIGEITSRISPTSKNWVKSIAGDWSWQNGSGKAVLSILVTPPKIPSPMAIPHLPGALRGTELFWKGMNMLLLHFGVIPDSHIYRLLGCHMEWNKSQRYWYPSTDQWGRTNYEQIFAAGDGSGVLGALAAEYKGELAALEVAFCLGLIPKYERDSLAFPVRGELRQDGYPRPLIDAVYAPDPKQFNFDKTTVLCRCENITVGDVRKVVGEGVTDLNEVKIITRCGMGPCQGRMCGPALGEIVAAELDSPVQRAGLLTIRPPLNNGY